MRVLVFAAHPDDELIGVGGTIARLSREGADVLVVIYSRGGGGVAAEEAPLPEEAVEEERDRETAEVAGLLGFRHRVLGRREIVDRREAVKEAVKIVRDYRPNVVFTHSPWDRHHLHVAVSGVTTEAVWQASTRAYGYLGAPWRVDAVYYYEVWDLFTRPSLLVDITDYLDLKVKAMGLYRSQLKVFPGITEYLEGLARVRGYLAGTRYAEAFKAADALPAVAPHGARLGGRLAGLPGGGEG